MKYGDDIPRTFIPQLECRPFEIQWTTEDDLKTPVLTGLIEPEEVDAFINFQN